MNVTALPKSVQSSFRNLLASESSLFERATQLMRGLVSRNATVRGWARCLLLAMCWGPAMCWGLAWLDPAAGWCQEAEGDAVGRIEEERANRPSNLDRRRARPGSFSRPLLIELDGEIAPSDTADIRNRLQRAKSAGADLVILEIDSPGGYKTESLAIGELLRDLDWAYVVAFVPREAISGAALLSFGADEIYAAPEMRFGDIGPIHFDPTEFAFRLVPAKLQSVLVREARDLAAAKGYPPDLAEAMVDKDVLVFQRQGPDGKLEFRRAHVNDQERPADDWKLIEESGPERFLTLNGVRAKELGLVRELVRNREDLAQAVGFNSADLIVHQVNWADRVARVLNTWWMTAILVVIGLLALYLELTAPGIGVGSLVAGLCAMLFFWSHFLGGTADWLEVLLFVAGIVCLAMELFVIPGTGIAGLLGMLLLLSSVVMATQDFVIPSNGEQWNQFLTSLLTLLCALALVALGAILITKKLGKSPGFNQMVLAPRYEQPTDLKSDSATGKPLKPSPAPHPAVSVGDWGKADSPLRPAGRVNFAGLSVDAISDGQFVERGQQVKVLRIQGNVIVVAPVEEV
ncbi:MAG: NfeD family protein [Planctomycetota bacterium]